MSTVAPPAEAPANAARTDNWLPKVDARDLAASYGLHRHRRPIEALVAGQTITIETAASSALGSRFDSFAVTVSGRPALLRLSSDIIDLCARALAISGFDRLGATQSAILLELALLRPIKALEARLRSELRINRRATTTGPLDQSIVVHFLVRGLSTGDAGAELHLDRHTAAAVARALDPLATPNTAAERLLIPVRICFGSADLVLAELQALRPGDIVFSDPDVHTPAEVVAMVGERLAYCAEPAEHGFRLLSTHHSGGLYMQLPNEAPESGPPNELALEQLPIRIVFELGRLELPLAEIRRLAPGYVIPLVKPVDGAVEIVANGRKIGHGSLLKVGESIGVRVERLRSDEQL